MKITATVTSEVDWTNEWDYRRVPVIRGFVAGLGELAIFPHKSATEGTIYHPLSGQPFWRTVSVRILGEVPKVDGRIRGAKSCDGPQDAPVLGTVEVEVDKIIKNS